MRVEEVEASKDLSKESESFFFFPFPFGTTLEGAFARMSSLMMMPFSTEADLAIAALATLIGSAAIAKASTLAL